MIVSLLAGLALAKNPCADPRTAETASAAMKNLYDDYESAREDRSSSSALLSDEVRKADRRRVGEVVKLDKQDRLCTGQDKWYAAWIMQSATSLDQLERSYELALEAMEERVPRGAWLTAYAYDRMRTADGYRQAFGTQTRIDGSNRRCLVELDGSVDDDKRQSYGVPPLGALYRQVLDVNGHDRVKPTEAQVREHNLMCNPIAIADRKSIRRAPGN